MDTSDTTAITPENEAAADELWTELTILYGYDEESVFVVIVLSNRNGMKDDGYYVSSV